MCLSYHLYLCDKLYVRLPLCNHMLWPWVLFLSIQWYLNYYLPLYCYLANLTSLIGSIYVASAESGDDYIYVGPGLQQKKKILLVIFTRRNKFFFSLLFWQDKKKFSKNLSL